MKKEFTTLLCLSMLMAGGMQSISAQTRQEEGLPPAGTNFCKTHEVMETLYQSNPKAKAEQDAREAFTQQYVKDHPNAGYPEKASVLAKYRIPVVMHVYGGPTHTFWGKTVTKAIIDAAMVNLNKDWQGLNSDYSLVNNTFATIKSKLDISFELALKKPDGSVTDGVDWKTTTGAGYGNGSGMDAQIAADAWDNKMYMNVYIVADLYNDGVNNNSGVCWYPDVSMTNAKTARLVYNGQYLGSNTTQEFSSVFTHETGHFMNLAHTFDTGCTGTGDGVTDTPLHSSTSLGCPTSQTSKDPISDCGNWQINSENYMDYNGAFSCYRNYTAGQIARVTAALNLNDVTRFPLWQTSNLINTGLLPATGIENIAEINISNFYPNPSDGKFQFEINVSRQDNYTIEVGNMFGQIVYRKSLGNISGNYEAQIDITKESQGVYFLSVIGSDSKKVVKLIKQ